MSTPVTQYTSLARLGRRLALRDIPEAAKLDKINEVSRLMDGYFRERYTLPFNQVGLDMQLNCEAITTWLLLLDRGINPNAGMGEEALKDAYDKAIAWLKAVANPNGGVSPDVTDSSSAAVEGPSVPRAAVKSQCLRGMVGVGLSGGSSGISGRGGQYPGWPDGTA